MRYLLLFCLVVLTSCGHKPQHGHYSIGRDSSWFPLNFGERANDLTAFTNELVQKIAKEEDVPMHIVDISWIQLFQNLQEERYAGLFSSLSPDVISTSKYSFSDPILDLGPVLVVPEHSPYTSLAQIHTKVVGVDRYGDAVQLVQQHPSLIIKMYSDMNNALVDLEYGEIDAILLPNLDAQTTIPARFKGVLKIASEPLTDKAIRLLTLKDKNQNLLRHFNNGLRNIKQSDEYRNLQKEFFLLLNNHSSR